jgi:iron complex outermembrane recepter protein
MRNKKLLLSGIFILLINAVFAQQSNGIIAGTVTSKDGVNVSNVAVSVKETKQTTITNTEGYYIFTGLPSGKYTVVLSIDGLTKQLKKVVVNESTTTQNFSLLINQQEINDVVVSAHKKLNKSTNIGKLPVDPMDLPQATTVLDKQLLDRQQVQTLGDAVQNVNGVYIMGTTGGYQEELASRGFAFGSNNTFKNGVRFNNSMMPEVSGMESIEILKGGNAILFGTVGAGGVLNIVTKKPKFNTGGSVSFQTGSFGYLKPAIDVFGSIGKSKYVAYRLNGSFTKAGSFRDNLTSQRYYINPSLLFKIGSKTEVVLEGDYTQDKRGLDYGTGAIYYTLAATPRNLNLNVPWSYVNSNQLATTITATHQFNSNWQLRSVVSTRSFDNELFGTARPNSNSQFIDSSRANYGRWVRGLVKNKNKEKYHFASFDVTGKFNIGSTKHTILTGFDMDKLSANAYAFDYTKYRTDGKNIYDTINIFGTKQYGTRNDMPDVPWTYFTYAPVNRFGIYVQDFVALSNTVKMLAGIRYTTSKIGKADSIYANGRNRNYYDTKRFGAFSPRVGVVYQPTQKISVFSSYTNTYEINTAIDTLGNILEPSVIDQYEVGIKTLLLKNAISVNATAYIINNNNAVQSYPNLAPTDARREIGGQTRSKGFELDITSAPIHGFTINAGYSYNDIRYVKSTLFVEGSKLRYTPNHTANIRLYYSVKPTSKLSGLNMGVGMFYVGERVAGRSVTKANPNYALIPLPEYTLLEASMGYNIQKLSFRIKVNNILDKLSYNVHDDNSVNPIAPRQLVATVAYKF